MLNEVGVVFEHNILNLLMKPVLVIGCGMLYLLTGCQDNKNIQNSSASKDNFEFYYFPKTNTYYDLRNKTYVYSLDSTRTWNSVKEESNDIPGILGKKEVLNSSTDSVWKLNYVHRQTYGGHIYHIIKESNNLPSSFNDAREKRPAVKVAKKLPTVAPIIDSSKPARKGIRGFFNRLFGKHKKK